MKLEPTVVILLLCVVLLVTITILIEMKTYDKKPLPPGVCNANDYAILLHEGKYNVYQCVVNKWDPK